MGGARCSGGIDDGGHPGTRRRAPGSAEQSHDGARHGAQADERRDHHRQHPSHDSSLAPLAARGNRRATCPRGGTPAQQRLAFDGLRAVISNGTLARTPRASHTDLLIEVGAGILQKHGVAVEVIGTIDQDIATGVYPDMRDHGWERDAWPEMYRRVQRAHVVVLAGPV